MSTLPIFCINVVAAKHRWERMTGRFSEAGIKNVIHWPAATPDDLGSLPYAHYLRPGERGCAKSHYDLWSYIVEKNIPRALVFEDDAVLRHDFWSILKPKLDSIDSSDPEWDMLLLNASEEVLPVETWLPTKNQCMTAGYVISLRGATHLVNLGKTTLYASDWMTQLLQNRGHTYCYFPWLVIQDGSDSTIRTTPAIEDWKKVNRLLRTVNYSIDNYNF
jgi:GR25 family glycosyltransferase involved in LPS biosynthesis